MELQRSEKIAQYKFDSDIHCSAVSSYSKSIIAVGNYFRKALH